MPDEAEQPLGWAIPSHPAPPTPSTQRAMDSTCPCESICSGLSTPGLDLLLLRFQSAEVHPNQPHPSLRRKARKKVIALNLRPSWILGFRVGSRSNKMASPKRSAAIHSRKATPSAEETIQRITLILTEIAARRTSGCLTGSQQRQRNHTCGHSP